MFIKLKSNGTLKTRLVAGGNDMDKAIYVKETRSSPTVHLENLSMQLVMLRHMTCRYVVWILKWRSWNLIYHFKPILACRT